MYRGLMLVLIPMFVRFFRATPCEPADNNKIETAREMRTSWEIACFPVAGPSPIAGAS